jgi:hypothetical protein
MLDLTTPSLMALACVGKVVVVPLIGLGGAKRYPSVLPMGFAKGSTIHARKKTANV